MGGPALGDPSGRPGPALGSTLALKGHRPTVRRQGKGDWCTLVPENGSVKAEVGRKRTGGDLDVLLGHHGWGQRWGHASICQASGGHSGVTEQAAVTSSMMETELGEIDPGSQGQEQAVAMVWTPTEATPRAESCVSATSLTLVAVVSGMPEVSPGNHEAENAGHS